MAARRFIAPREVAAWEQERLLGAGDNRKLGKMRQRGNLGLVHITKNYYFRGLPLRFKGCNQFKNTGSKNTSLQ
jgi:hypothetical protein